MEGSLGVAAHLTGGYQSSSGWTRMGLSLAAVLMDATMALAWGDLCLYIFPGAKGSLPVTIDHKAGFTAVGAGDQCKVELSGGDLRNGGGGDGIHGGHLV